jgi:hypothetical protein
VGLTYRELTPEEFHLAPREVPGSDVYTAHNSRILAAFNEKGEVVSTWTMFGMIHIEPFWVREDYRGSPTIMRRMAEKMKALLRDSNIGCVYTVVLDNTPVLRKFAEWFGGKKVDGILYYWVDGNDKSRTG